MSSKGKDPKKTVDLPPHGPRNPDPITDAPGAHPIETGVGAALGGTAAGMAVGMLGGPVGAVIGGIVGGAVAGGLAGKGVGELIDPTTEDTWLNEYYGTEKRKIAHATPDTYRPAYRYGIVCSVQNTGKRFEDVEPHLSSNWEKARGESKLSWDQARGAVRDAYDRSFKLHEERLKTTKQQVRTGEVDVRKEVVTEHKQITVPIEREEVVIERRAVSGGATSANPIRAEEIRIPVKEEKVHVTKETVVKEEVNVGKRKVHDTATVGGEVRHEELKVEEKGKAKAKHEKH
jgi:uncharacterized protein (TIGR02271 family)